MIFDCDQVTLLVAEWQRTQDSCLMPEILDKSRELVEVIVSTFDPIDREDLIQESMLRIQYAVQFYNPRISNLHNYLTTVIRNTCATHSRRYDRDSGCADIDGVEEYRVIATDDFFGSPEDDELLCGLIERNRNRFPSIPAVVLDDLTEHLYYALREGGVRSKVISNLSSRFSVSKSIVTAVCNSSLIYLRAKNITCAQLTDKDSPEFSLLADLRDVLDPRAYKQMMIVFSGMTLHIPQ